jgi:hypothetical protein
MVVVKLLVLCNNKCATKSFTFVEFLNVFVDYFIVLEVNRCMLMKKTFESGWDLYLTL